MTAQQVQITLDYSQDVAQLEALSQVQGSAARCTAVDNAVAAVASVITKKAMMQRDILDQSAPVQSGLAKVLQQGAEK